MGRSFRLWQDGHIVSLLAPATDAAGRTSGYVSLENAHKAYLVCYIAQGNAATVALTPLQATDAAGSNSKAISAVVPIVANLDDSVSDILAIKTDALSYTTDAGTKNKIVVFEIDPIRALDMDDSEDPRFSHIAISTGASNASNVTSALLVLMPLRNAMSPAATTFGV